MAFGAVQSNHRVATRFDNMKDAWTALAIVSLICAVGITFFARSQDSGDWLGMAPMTWRR